MEARTDLLEHARTALERSARALSDMRARLEATAPVGRQHRLQLEGAIHDLSRRYEALAHLYGAMAEAQAGELRGLWQQFFACYDTYLEALRATRSQLAMGAGVESRGAAALQSSRPSGDEGKP
jgi:hypothetical protein